MKIHWLNLKIFSRTTGPISTKLSTRHPWVKEIQVCSKEGPNLFPRGDNYEKAKHIDEIKKIFSLRTTYPISTKLGTRLPWLKGIQVCSIKGPLFQGEIITKWWKYIDEIKKSSSREPLSQFQPNLAQSILGWNGLNYSNNGHRPFPRGDNYKMVKIHWRN